MKPYKKVLKSEIRDRFRKSYLDENQKYKLDACITEYFKQSYEYAVSVLLKEIVSFQMDSEADSKYSICEYIGNLVEKSMEQWLLLNSEKDSSIEREKPEIEYVNNGQDYLSAIPVTFDNQFIYDLFSGIIIICMFNDIYKYGSEFYMNIFNLAVNEMAVSESPNDIKSYLTSPSFYELSVDNVKQVGIISLSIEFVMNHVDSDVLYESIQDYFEKIRPFFYKIVKDVFIPQEECQIKASSLSHYNFRDIKYESLLDVDNYYKLIQAGITRMNNYCSGNETNKIFDTIMNDEKQNYLNVKVF